MKIIMDVANGIYHKRATKINSKYLILCTKKNNKRVDLSMHIFKSPNFIRFGHFSSSEYKLCEVDILHVCGIHHWMHQVI